MPISPENKPRYPADWAAISRRIRFNRAGGRCECRGECGIDHRGFTGAARCPAVNGMVHPDTGHIVVLSVGHRDHQPEHNQADNLRAWCQRCHNNHDLAHRLENRLRRARQGKARGDLFEGEWQ